MAHFKGNCFYALTICAVLQPGPVIAFSFSILIYLLMNPKKGKKKGPEGAFHILSYSL
jgi:hypothetical protein